MREMLSTLPGELRPDGRRVVVLRASTTVDGYTVVKLEDGRGSSLETCEVWRWWEVWKLRVRGELPPRSALTWDDHEEGRSYWRVSQHTFGFAAWASVARDRRKR